MQRRPKRFAA